MTQTLPNAPAASAESAPLFRTDHLQADLKGRSIRGGAVTLTAQAVKFALQLGSTAILARLLTPADFGLVAMVAAFTGFVSLFKDLGLSMATVQRAEITHEQVSTLFWINVALSVALMGVAAALAPAVAWFYGEPKLTWIMLVVAGTFIFGGLSAQHTALLRRQMRFTALAAIEVSSIAAGIAVAILMAWHDFGFWSLVAMGAASAAATVALCWMFSNWRPGLPRRGCGVRPMLTYGGNLTGFNLANYFSRHADDALIGRFIGAEGLGVYSKAYGLLLMPLRQINAPITAVAVPALSRLQADPRRFRAGYLKALQLSCWLSMPLIGMLAGCAQFAVTIVLGQQWLTAAPIFEILALAAALQPAASTTGWLYQATGRTREMFHWGIGSSIVIVSSFLVGLPWGITGVAASYTLCYVLVIFLPCIWLATRGTPVTVADVIKAAAPPLLAAATLYLVTRAIAG